MERVKGDLYYSLWRGSENLTPPLGGPFNEFSFLYHQSVGNGKCHDNYVRDMYGYGNSQQTNADRHEEQRRRNVLESN